MGLGPRVTKRNMYITSKSLLSLKALRIPNPQGVIAEENPSLAQLKSTLRCSSSVRLVLNYSYVKRKTPVMVGNISLLFGLECVYLCLTRNLETNQAL
jgi:hypothetical protein